MKKSKKITSMLLIAMLASFAACGNANSTESKTVESQSVAESVAESAENSATVEDAETTDTASETTAAEAETAVAVEVPDDETSVEQFLAYVNENGVCDGISMEDVEYTSLDLNSDRTVKKWHNGESVHLVNCHKVTSVNEEILFEGVVLEGYIGTEAVSIYFIQNDSGQLVTEGSFRLTSFLSSKEMQEL